MAAGGFYGTTPRSGGTTQRSGGTTPRSCRAIIPESETGEGTNLESLLVKQHQLIASLITENKTLQSEVSSFSTQLKEVKEDLNLLKDYVEHTKPVQENKRLPKALTLAVKKLHQGLENQFDGSKLFNNEYNSTVAAYLEENLKKEYDDQYSGDIIHRAVSRYYESRRRIFNDSLPERQTAKEMNNNKTKIRNRQRQLYTRRLKLCRNARERKVMEELNELYMTEETDDDDTGILHQHKPQWRSPKLNKILKVLDKRDEASHKSHPRKQRTLSTSSSSTAPIYAPSWTTIELDKSKERDQDTEQVQIQDSSNGHSEPERVGRSSSTLVELTESPSQDMNMQIVDTPQRKVQKKRLSIFDFDDQFEDNGDESDYDDEF